ncbi:glycosyltransferase family 4 protein [Bradyrhizobium valentinum]|uniref:Glycosyl transferase n=1 Tax=Bradyrhizobium valentinum TaxID=1518501 RepID=A0A0R3KRS9_9BRAD|nr:glycosyltransferase family 1 protein [Bradyrhizobium valentinum]KRQ98347.1 glycosyl transferase [Bradyrhizobium valentinum]
MSKGSPIRLAFTMISRQSWAGGYNYQRNLFAALRQHCPGAITPVVFAGERDDFSDLEALGRIPDVEILQSSAFDRGAFRSIAPICFGQDFAAASAFRRKQIDAVFESARFFGWSTNYPSIAWIPDMQHLALPHLFSARARWRRDIGFRLQIISGRTIMLSSESAERDCLKSYPNAKGRTAVVKFASEPAPELLRADPAEVARKYALPPNYFYLPNQFWRHKNHQVVIDALALLLESGKRTVVVASGAPNPNEPQYVDKIMKQVVERGLDRAFRYVGMIPLAEVYALLRTSAALINPSRFEGWSTTVEEAKSFGVPMVLSDIDVHREQADSNAVYFDVNDPSSLANHLAKVLQNSEPALIRNLLPDVNTRVAAFASEFVKTVQRAKQHHGAAT